MGHDFPRKGGHPWDVGAILNYEFWRDQLGGSQKVIGQRSLRLGGENVLVLGVMPPGFDFPPGTDIWLPYTDGDVVVGRLRPRLSLAEAATALRGLGHKPSQAARRDAGPVVESLHSFLVGDRDWLLLTLWGVSFLFLLLACAGAANILLARGVKRRSEMVVRVTLGAGRPRLIRQLLAETLVLAAAGGLLGLGLAWACNRWIALLLPATQRFAPFPPTEIGLIVALTLAATLLCGLAPAFHATGGDLNRFLKAGTSGTTSPSAPRRFLSAHELLASGQLAVAMILLISTGLLLRSMVEHLRVPLGFRAKNVFVVETHLMELPEVAAAEASYFDTHPMKGAGSEYDRRMYQAIGPTIDKGLAQSATFYDEALRKLAALPGVESVAVMSPPPFGGVFSPRGYAIEARDAGHVREGDAFHIWAGANAFQLLGIRLLAGRDFNAADVESAGLYPPPAQPVEQPAIVSEALARDFWPNENPIGKMLSGGLADTRVIGVASDARFDSSPDYKPTIYFPFVARQGGGFQCDFLVSVRPGGSVTGFAPEVNRSLLPLSANLIPPRIFSLEGSTTKSLAGLRMAIVLLGCFAVLGVVVAGLGVYATGTLMAAARRREMGIRVALGAQREQIQRLVLWRGLRSVLIAVPAGMLGAWGVGRGLSHWLFRVAAADPMTYVASAGLLVALALLSGFLPARRAAAADPAATLRLEG